MKFSLAHLTVIGCPPPEMTYLAARAGYDYVSLRLIPMGVAGENLYLPEDKKMISDTRTALAQTGIEVWDIELARILVNKDPRDYLPAMEVAAELGARHVISSAWTNTTGDRDVIVEHFARLCDLAKPLGLTVNLEFPSFSRLTNLQQAADIVAAANRCNSAILLDTLYLHFSGVTPEEITALPHHWFQFIHVCDTSPEIPRDKQEMTRIARDNRLYIGEGCIDFSAIFKSLPADITCSIELPNLQRVKKYGYEEHARRCLASARKHLGAG
ncbi:Sugar phosphate isomerase/epimerase [Desulforhopalus singaporensis]|uniref:Sugar phosphate isomerase/epimerase n=2 Tax=Desulforhopalus singaporensis TaxID=91360 RepID=A0A1H0SRY3_9BACT|nr:Sugar phosphate isomerase/epimerase [Desulforhopalus singaporensis]